MIPDWDTNSLLCFLLKNFVYQSLTDLPAMLNTFLYLISIIEMFHIQPFFILMARVYFKFSFTIIYTRYSRKVPGLLLFCDLFSNKIVETSHTSGKNIFLHYNIYI